MFLRLLGWVVPVPVLLFVNGCATGMGIEKESAVFFQKISTPLSVYNVIHKSRGLSLLSARTPAILCEPGRHFRGNRQSAEKENLNSPCAMIHTISSNAVIMIITLHFHIFFVQPYVYKWSHQHFTHSLLWILTWIPTKSTIFFFSRRIAFIFWYQILSLALYFYLHRITKIRTNKRTFCVF